MNKSEIKIVPVSDNNAKDIQFLLHEASRSMYLDSGYTEEEFNEKFKDSLSENQINKCKEVISSLSQNEIYNVALLNDRVIGLCYITKEETKNILNALYVLPEFQNQRVGTMLWENTKNFLNSKNKTYLYVFQTNIKAIEFYKKIGFLDTGKIINEDRFTKKDGVVISEVEMILLN